MDFSQMTTPAIVAHANTLPQMTELELALLDRLQSAMEEIDSLVDALDNVEREAALQSGVLDEPDA